MCVLLLRPTEQQIKRLQQAQHTLVTDTVENVFAFAAGGNQTFAAQNAELLGEIGLMDSHLDFQIADTQLALAELTQQQQAILMSQRPQHQGGITRRPAHPVNIDITKIIHGATFCRISIPLHRATRLCAREPETSASAKYRSQPSSHQKTIYI